MQSVKPDEDDGIDHDRCDHEDEKGGDPPLRLASTANVLIIVHRKIFIDKNARTGSIVQHQMSQR
jgi:hypothetical protein